MVGVTHPILFIGTPSVLSTWLDKSVYFRLEEPVLACKIVAVDTVSAEKSYHMKLHEFQPIALTQLQLRLISACTELKLAKFT